MANPYYSVGDEAEELRAEIERLRGLLRDEMWRAREAGTENERLREAIREAIKLARDFNRGAMTWKEYDRKLTALHRLASDEGDQ